MLVDGAKLTLEDVFDLVSEKLSSYEHRPQQVELATLIHKCFSRQSVGIFEAGTGIGKSLAALIPAVISGKKTVVSTATIALQEQYIHKDIPSLQAILPFTFEAALIKGRGNYLSRRRYRDHVLEHEVDERISDWVNDTAAGDISELDFIPPGELWYEVNSDADDCLRNKCPNFKECFYFQAREYAQQADILVVNHALLLADAASGGSILPPYENLIIDEAQHLPDIATDAFSAGISMRGIRMTAARAQNKLNAPGDLIREIEMEAGEFFQRLGSTFSGSRTRLRNPIEQARFLHNHIDMLSKWIEEQDFSHILDVDMAREKIKLKAKAVATTLEGYKHCLETLVEPDPSSVIWAERSGKALQADAQRLEVVAAPLDVSESLKQLLVERPGLTSSVWMSATLATGGSDPFSYFKKQVGIEGKVIQAKIASPFDYPRQSILYLPKDLPEPNRPEFLEAAANEIERLVLLSEGRAFLLFTSYTAMNSAYTILTQRLPFDCKRQGEMPRKKLIDWFKATPQAVLFGTSSFWEGVSIDGEQLSLVVIDRIPFQVPDDPVYEARCEVLQQDNERSWFAELALPHAIMRLKQGVGRLIRTKQDRGIVAILDPRLTKKQYGQTILSCLPPMTISRKLDHNQTFANIMDSL